MLISGCNVELQGDLEEGEANEMILALAYQGIVAEKTKESSGSKSSWTVHVSKEEVTTAWKVLQASGLPRPRHEGFRSVYKERGLVPGKMEEKALYLSALQEEIAKTIETVEGVCSVRVHATVADSKKRHNLEPEKASASVLVSYYQNDSSPLPISKDEVKKIVANAIDGLSSSDVAVVFTPKKQISLPKIEVDENTGSKSMVKKAAAGLAFVVMLLGVVLVFRRKRTTVNVSTRNGRMI
jgi:type III secretion protein J